MTLTLPESFGHPEEQFMKLRHALFALAAAASAATALPALAQEAFTVGELTVNRPYIVATPKTAKSAAGYFSVTNAGSEADRLISIESDPRGALHETSTDGNGVTKMSEVEGIDLAPGESVTLRPRGMHVMFMGLTEPFLIGATLPAKLVFEKAGPVDVTFTVQSRAETLSITPAETPDAAGAAAGEGSAEGGAAGEGMSHEGMSHEGMSEESGDTPAAEGATPEEAAPAQ